jgi:hypothetical protein
MTSALPPDYLEIVAAGVETLRSIGRELRAAAERRPDVPELWLDVRNVEGLAGRLGDLVPYEWERCGGPSLANQDFGVLDELIDFGIDRGDVDVLKPSAMQVAALARLRQFLWQYMCDEFTMDDA